MLAKVELTPVAVACRRVAVLDPYALVMSLGNVDLKRWLSCHFSKAFLIN